MAFSIFEMPSSCIILLLSTAFKVTHALPWPGAQETKVYQSDVSNPAPTTFPVEPTNLFRKSAVGLNTCGWIGGNAVLPALCPVGLSCVYDTIHSYVGCCTTEGPCTQGVYTRCMDRNSAGWMPNAGFQNIGVFTCGGSDVCYRNTYPGGYYQYGCGSSNFATNVETTYSGQSSDVKLQQIFTKVTFVPTSTLGSTPTSASLTRLTSKIASPSSTSIHSTSSSSSAAGTSANISDSSPAPSMTLPAGDTQPTDTRTQSNVSKSSKSGEIFGITVGVAIALAALLLALFLLWRRRRKTHRAESCTSKHHQHKHNWETTSASFERIKPYGADTFSPPMTQEVDGRTPQRQNSQNWFQSSPPRSEHASLVEGEYRSETEDLSEGSHDAIDEPEQEDEDTSSVPRDPYTPTRYTADAVSGFGLSIAVARPVSDGSSEYSNDMNTEHANGSFRTRREGWVPQRLRTRTERNSASRNPEAKVESSVERGDQSPEIPPKSPLREGAVGLGRRSTTRSGWECRPRYQLVDGVIDENVPILQVPGPLRKTKIQSSQW